MKEKRKGRPTTFIKRHFPLLIAIALTVSVAIVLIYNWLLWEHSNSVVIYPLMFVYRTRGILCAVGVLPFIWLTFFAFWIWQPRRWQSCGSAIVFTMVANIAMCVCSIPLPFNQFWERQRTFFGSNLYILTGEWSVGVGNDHDDAFILYQCDRLGILCKPVFAKTYYASEDIPELENFGELKTDLLTDAQTNTVTVKINSKVFYTYTPG